MLQDLNHSVTNFPKIVSTQHFFVCGMNFAFPPVALIQFQGVGWGSEGLLPWRVPCVLGRYMCAETHACVWCAGGEPSSCFSSTAF